MTDLKRKGVIDRGKARQALRETVRSEVEQARHDLHPRNLATRWAGRQKAKLLQVRNEAKQKASNNAPAIGVGAAAILLFAARRPIWNLFQRLRNRRPESKDEEQ